MKGKTLLLLLLSFCFIASSCSAQQYKPPKVGQIVWERSDDTIWIAVEIINENSDVGLYRAPISIVLYNKDNKMIGTNTIIGDFDIIRLLLPNEKIIYAEALLDIKEDPANIKVTFPNLKWINFSNINIPKISVSEQNFIYDDEYPKLLCMINNESNSKLEGYLVIAFYVKGDKLWGARRDLLGYIQEKSAIPYEEKFYIQPPKDAEYIIKVFPERIPALEK
jgi:hypothetical protein